MFRNCTDFALRKLDTGRAVSLAFMFYFCSAVESLDLYYFDTANMTSLNYTFHFCQKLADLDLGNWDTRKLDAFAQAFRNMSAIRVIDISGWKMPEYTSTMQYAFYNCANLTTIYAPAGCDLSDTAVGNGCFQQCGKLVGGNGTAYSSANVTAAMARVDELVDKAGYFTAR